jgi:hypothetical protein
VRLRAKTAAASGAARQASTSARPSAPLAPTITDVFEDEGELFMGMLYTICSIQTMDEWIE